MKKRQRVAVASVNLTDVRTRKTTEYVALFDTDMLNGVINGMADRGIQHLEIMEGMLIIVSRPQPAGDTV